jgi:hypothetical protein
MRESAENLTRWELAAAVHAIARGAGQSSFSPEYQTAIGEILAAAEDATLIRPEYRIALERRIRDGVPEPESAAARVGSEAEIYGFSVLDGFLHARDQSQPLLVVTWTTDFLDRVIHPMSRPRISPASTFQRRMTIWRGFWGPFSKRSGQTFIFTRLPRTWRRCAERERSRIETELRRREAEQVRLVEQRNRDLEAARIAALKGQAERLRRSRTLERLPRGYANSHGLGEIR